jgi:hypothetical protein
MNKKLTAKVQKLSPPLKDQLDCLSGCVVIEPEDKEHVLKKGAVYAVFNITSEISLDVSVVTKVINDVLFDAHYGSESVSPVQSLEKAIAEVRDKVVHLPSGGSSLRENKIEFNFLAGALWGNVLYVVQYGKAHSYLMRGGEVRTIQSIGEGNFSASSGVVEDDDVVILCTESFAKKFPPKKLLTLAMSEKDLDESQACLLLKFIGEKDFTEEEMTALSPKGAPVKKKKAEEIIETLVKKLQTNKTNVKLKFSELSKRKEEVERSQETAINSITEIRKRRTKKQFSLDFIPKFKFNPKVAVSVFLVVLFASGVFVLVHKIKKPAVDNKENVAGVTTETPPQPPVEVINHEEDAKNKVQRVTPAVLYDIKIADEKADPSEIFVYKDKIVAVDKTNGKVYRSLIKTPKFEADASQLPAIKHLAIDDKGAMTFSDSEGFKVYDLLMGKITQKYVQENTGVLGVFLDFIYSIEGGKIVKYKKAAIEKLTGSTWGESSDFVNAKSMKIAYSIYVITESNNLVSYTTGKKDVFEIKGLDKPLKDAKEVVTETAFSNVYILDAGENRIVVLDKKGNFIKQYKNQDVSSWKSLRSITVSLDEKIIYVLDGSKVYEVKI